MFKAHKTALSIAEDAQVPQLIASFEATDADEGRFGQLVYKLEQLDYNSNDADASMTQHATFALETSDGKAHLT